MTKLGIGFVAIAILAASAAVADHTPDHVGHGAGAEHSGHGQHASPPTTKDLTAEEQNVVKAYDDAMQKMHKAMAIPYTGDVDVDFVRGMIPHHQGAIDQAEVLLQHSKDLRLKRLAGGIIAAQKREIRFMVKWLKEHEQGIQSSEIPDWLKAEPSNAEEPADAEATDQR